MGSDNLKQISNNGEFFRHIEILLFLLLKFSSNKCSLLFIIIIKQKTRIFTTVEA